MVTFQPEPESTLILDFQPPERCEIHIGCLSHKGGIFVIAAGSDRDRFPPTGLFTGCVKVVFPHVFGPPN